MRDETAQELLQSIYDLLLKAFGSQYWWPGETPFEIMVGAILTQNTNWGNVEKAIQNLKDQKTLSVDAIYRMPPEELAVLIKPSGFFNVKANRLKNFVSFLVKEYAGDLKAMAREETFTLRAKMLEVNGVGPETVDSILLYALGKPVFVIDAYTKRVLFRHKVIALKDTYADVQKLFMANLKEDPMIFNEYHALFVKLAKDFCRVKPRCEGCPLLCLL